MSQRKKIRPEIVSHPVSLLKIIVLDVMMCDVVCQRVDSGIAAHHVLEVFEHRWLRGRLNIAIKRCADRVLVSQNRADDLPSVLRKNGFEKQAATAEGGHEATITPFTMHLEGYIYI